MTETTYIRNPLRPMTIAGDIREMAVAVQMGLLPFSSQLGMINSQLANEFCNCLSNVYAAMIAVADRKELQVLYGLTDQRSETVDLYTPGIDREKRDRLLELFNTYFYYASEDDPKRNNWYNIRTGDIKNAANSFELIPPSTTGAFPNIVTWDLATCGTSTTWEYKLSTRAYKAKRKRSTIHKPCRCGSGMNFNHYCNKQGK